MKFKDHIQLKNKRFLSFKNNIKYKKVIVPEVWIFKK